MNRPLVPLLPRPTANSANDGQAPKEPAEVDHSRRVTIAVACDRCRKRKSKCDGTRPECSRCRRTRGVVCHYETEEGSTSLAVARKEAAAKLAVDHQQLMEDRAMWEELFENLRQRPEDEAIELLRRLRLSSSPNEILDFIRHGDILLNAISTARTKQESQLQTAALSAALIKVPAKPWTFVAQDGIVSELVSAWFKWDDAFGYPFLDREAFVTDMRSANIENSRYCSPFLVNALCAFRCFMSEHMRYISRVLQIDFRARFYAEAKKLYDLDQRASITNVQGLWILFMYSCAVGTDRAGSMYRFAAYEMLKRMRLQSRYNSLRDDNAEHVLEKRAISKLYWGIFCFESLASQAFLEPSMMKTPWMESPYAASPSGLTKDDNIDMFGERFANGKAVGPPLVMGARFTAFQLCKLMNKVLEYITSIEPDRLAHHTDLEQRAQLYARLEEFCQSLPDNLRQSHNFTQQNCFIWIFYNTIAYNILRNLKFDEIFTDGKTVKEHILKHCALDTSIMERAMKAGFFTEWSIVVVCGVFHVMSLLVPLLQDEEARSIFCRSCAITHVLSQQLPILTLLLHGVRAMAFSLHQQIPAALNFIFDSLNDNEKPAADIPTAYQLPHPGEFRSALLDDNIDTADIGVDLSLVIARWSATSTV